jgi:hypothetical protein
MGQVRVRNIEYALTGSVDSKDNNGAVKFRLEPNVWTTVPDEVFEMLQHKFGNARYSDAPASLPGADGNYYGFPGQQRAEQTNGQYLVEFRK